MIIASIRALILIVLVIFVIAESATSVVAPMKEKEKETLYSVIQSFVGKRWNGSDLYPDPCGWTPIQGVSCDFFEDSWYVTELYLGPLFDNSLLCVPNADFNSGIFELRYLKSISFYKCFMSPSHNPVEIPNSNWEKLAGSIETIDFRSNPGLIGEIPSEFRRLSNLQSLVLIQNGLTGKIPMELGFLSKLKRIVLSENRFSGEIPPEIGNLNELLILDASRNNLTGHLPSTIGGLTSILKIDLSDNHLHGKLPKELGNLKNLTLIDLRNNGFSGGLPNSIADIFSVEEMLLSNNPIGGVLASVLWMNLHKLTVLDLSNLGLTGEIPDTMAELKNLRFLGLNNNQLSGNLTSKLEELPSIASLYLNGNNLTGALGFSEGFYMKIGKRLTVWSNPHLCYPVDLLSPSYLPSGVKPCNGRNQLSMDSIRLRDGNQNLDSGFVASDGSLYRVRGCCRFLVDILVGFILVILLF